MAEGDGTDLGICMMPGMQSVSETVSITMQSLYPEGALTDTEPTPKKQKLEDIDDATSHTSLRQMMFNINRAICLRLDTIETKLEAVQNKTKELEEKVDTILNHLVATQNAAVNKESQHFERPAQIVVGVPNRMTMSPDATTGPQEIPKIYDGIPAMGPNITLITLNREEDHPEGAWLGDEHNPEMRVRVPITPSDLIHIHSNCRTAEKMALTFLDYLFDRETQASSNLSGMGKHGKKQLDPLMIYGIRCHLISRFNLTEQDWHRIKQNMDSKCRTAFRRKQRGLPLTVKAFRGKASVSDSSNQGFYEVIQGMHDLSSHSDDSLHQSEEGELRIQREALDVSHDGVLMNNLAQMLQNQNSGEIQVVHATPEQVAQLQQTHQIQIVQGDQVIGQLTNGQDGEMEIQVRVSLPNDHNGLQIVGDTVPHTLIGETVGPDDSIHTIIKGEPGLDPKQNCDLVLT